MHTSGVSCLNILNLSSASNSNTRLQSSVWYVYKCSIFSASDTTSVVFWLGTSLLSRIKFNFLFQFRKVYLLILSAQHRTEDLLKTSQWCHEKKSSCTFLKLSKAEQALRDDSDNAVSTIETALLILFCISETFFDDQFNSVLFFICGKTSSHGITDFFDLYLKSEIKKS